MGFFDTLGNMFGFGDASTSFNFKAQAPKFISEGYVPSLENKAIQLESRPETTSFAEALLAKQKDDTFKQAMAMGTGRGGGVSPALTQRLAAQNAGQAGAQAAQSAGLMRAQESMENRKLNDEMAFRYRQMGLSAAQAQAQADLDAQRINAHMAEQNAATQQQAIGGVGSTIGSAIGSIFGFSEGGKVPGVAEKAGDHEVNDKVPAMLSPGEIVIPRSAAKDADKAKEFIDHLKGNKSKPNHFGAVLKKQREIMEKMKELESLIK